MGLALVAVVAYISLMTTKVVSGVSLTVDTPDYVVRLRILDAGGGDAKMVASEIRPYLGSDFDLIIVETADFEGRDLPHSFIIAHGEDMKVAQALAKRLGLDPDEVAQKTLEYNQTQASATLVAGLDFDTLLSLAQKPEED